MLNPMAADEEQAFRYLLLLTDVYPLLKACAQDGVGPPTPHQMNAKKGTDDLLVVFTSPHGTHSMNARKWSDSILALIHHST